MLLLLSFVVMQAPAEAVKATTVINADFGIQAKPVQLVQVPLVKKATKLLDAPREVLLTRSEPLTPLLLPEWKRPLPAEPSIPLLNVLSTPLPEVTSGILIVPALGLEEPITRVFVRDGQWDVSELDAQIGHLQTTGERPGEGLAMTFVGHTTIPWPGEGPFAHLNQLAHGEQIIYRWNGIDYVYQIDRMVHVVPSQVQTLYEENGNAIVLATCSGWNPATHEYDTRLVTRAILVDQLAAPPNPRLQLLQ